MAKKDIILAIDTATEFCSAALYNKGKMYVKEQLAPQKHASLVLNMVDELLNQAQLQKQDIELIAFGKGPGSFTGVRIATAVAQSLALGLNVKVFGVNELHMLALQAFKANENADYALGCIDARMNEVYYALFDKEGNEVVTTAVLPPQKAVENLNSYLSKNIALSGTGIALLDIFKQEPRDYPLYPLASSAIELYLKHDFETVEPEFAEPLYCRNEVTWKKISEQ